MGRDTRTGGVLLTALCGNDGMIANKERKTVSDRKRFAVGAKVRVRIPGVNGVVKEVNDEPTALGEYWHKIETAHGERKEPGSNLELVPKAQS